VARTQATMLDITESKVEKKKKSIDWKEEKATNV
jgi:hypothetical protein